MRWIFSIVGAVLVLIGAFWFLQGINVIPVGFMAGRPEYAILGFVVAVLGVGLIVFANRRFARARATGSPVAKPPSERDRGTV